MSKMEKKSRHPLDGPTATALGGGAIGGVIGGALSPNGKELLGILRGAGIGAIAGVGSYFGGLGGSLAGSVTGAIGGGMLSRGLSDQQQYDAQDTGSLLGGGLGFAGGATAGGMMGYQAGKKLLWPKDWSGGNSFLSEEAKAKMPALIAKLREIQEKKKKLMPKSAGIMSGIGRVADAVNPVNWLYNDPMDDLAKVKAEVSKPDYEKPEPQKISGDTKDMMKEWLSWLLVGGGVGIGAGGLASLYRLLSRDAPNKGLIEKVTPKPTEPIKIPVKPGEEKKKKKQTANYYWKKAGLDDLKVGARSKVLPVISTLTGADEAADKFIGDKPFMETAQIMGDVLAGAGGLIGGYKLIDWFARGKSKDELKKRIAAAKLKYVASLRDLTAMNEAKKSSYEFPEILDDITDVSMNKEAFHPAAILLAGGGLLTVLHFLRARARARKAKKDEREKLKSLIGLSKQRELAKVPEFEAVMPEEIGLEPTPMEETEALRS